MTLRCSDPVEPIRDNLSAETSANAGPKKGKYIVPTGRKMGPAVVPTGRKTGPTVVPPG